MSQNQPKFGTASGILAMVLWSSTLTLSRTLSEKIGMLQAAAIVYILGGSLACVYFFVNNHGWQKCQNFSAKYLTVCGGLFALYTVSLYAAIGLSVNRQQALESGIINYLWPGLTLLFAVPILGCRAAWSLLPGIVIAFAGVALAIGSRERISWQILWDNLRYHHVAYCFALTAAVTWALYSNLSRRWTRAHGQSAVPIFLLLTGLLIGAIALFYPVKQEWSLRVVAEAIYAAIMPTFLAYVLWDYAMIHGRIVLLAALSNFIPVLATVIFCLYFRYLPNPGLYLAVLLVASGAVVCNYSLRE